MSSATSHTEMKPVLGSKWRNRKSGIVAEVIKVEGDNVHLKREKMATTIKWLPHLGINYELVTDDLQGTKP